MAQQAPAAPANPAPAADTKGLVPPDEAFWIRYSPHHELPLSSVSSFAIHALIIGLLLLLAYPLAHLFVKPLHRPAVEAVRFESGGGGGKAHGVGGGKGVDTRPPEEAGKEISNNPDENPPAETTRRPDLDRIKAPDFQARFDPEAIRYINQPNPPPNLGKIALLDESVRRKIQPGKPQNAGKGGGGSGSGGGTGDGRGKGEGDGSGDGKGKGTLTQREKRMLRWTMLFSTNNGPDYLAQLRGLGAILAIPVKETAEGREYKIVRNLNSPAQLLDEDIGNIQRIYWIDDKPPAVRDIMGALGLSIRPSHFVAFMPEELENKLFELERARAGGRPEEKINETKFRVVRTAKGYEPQVETITFK
jgi:hypothetical protein